MWFAFQSPAPSPRYNGPIRVPAIQFDAVAYTQPSGARIFDSLTLGVNAGEVLALVGRSGAGKTTLLRLVNRLALPQSGRVLVGGRDTREWDPIRLRRSIGYVIQDVGLFPHMTVADNIGVVPRLEKWDPHAFKPGRGSCSSSSAFRGTHMQAVGPRSCQAGSASASAWRGPWRRIPRSC